jgi:hypothetical protein
MLLYIESIIEYGWPILYKPLQTVVDSGWSLEELLRKLQQDPTCNVTVLGPHPNAGVALAGVRLMTSDNDLPNFSPKEMHHQIVKFIVADDQVSSCLLSARYY